MVIRARKTVPFYFFSWSFKFHATKLSKVMQQQRTQERTDQNTVGHEDSQIIPKILCMHSIFCRFFWIVNLFF